MVPIKYKKTIFIFRRDLRIYDNIALHAALVSSSAVFCFFIIDPCQVSDKNPYRSARALHFMEQALQSLAQQFKDHGAQLHILYGNTKNIIEDIIKAVAPEALFLNYDYTPFSRKRDAAIMQLCATHQVSFSGYHDALLIGDPALVVSGSGTPYRLYTPFYNKAVTIPIAPPEITRYHHLASLPHHTTMALVHVSKLAEYLGITQPLIPPNKVMGTHKAALHILETINRQQQYAKTRDFPIDPTTYLASYLKFGLLSIRHVYYAIQKILGPGHALIRQLYWRDFFTYVCYHTPSVLGAPYNKAYAHIPWSSNETDFLRWGQGSTGFPLVDAGMRELNATGFMHNRVRMLVASFLIKDLHIDWQWGERYFAQQLIDYDPAVNNGNWQWVASTGCDALPYIRIFNPWTQQKKFDAQALYIKQWIPELQEILVPAIHTWYKAEVRSHYKSNYPAPMVDHERERKNTLKVYVHYKNKL